MPVKTRDTSRKRSNKAIVSPTTIAHRASVLSQEPELEEETREEMIARFEGEKQD
jgi:hypothetical protein